MIEMRAGVDLSAGGLAMQTVLTFWELGQDFSVVASKEHVIDAYCMLHDTMVTENYYLVWQVRAGHSTPVFHPPPLPPFVHTAGASRHAPATHQRQLRVTTAIVTVRACRTPATWSLLP